MSRALLLHLAMLTAPLAALLAAAMPVAAVTPPATPVEPRYEIVEALGATDFIADIASDPRGARPAFAFYDTTRADTLTPSQVPVRVARYDRFSRVIATVGHVNGRTANSRDLRLSIDQTGAAHVLAIETNTLDLGASDDAIVYFGTGAGGAPIREVVDTNNVSQITMAISSTEEPYIAYIKSTGSNPNFLRTLVVRRRDAGAWTQVPLDNTPTNASAPSFAPSPTEDVAYSLHLAWAETAFSAGVPGGSAIRYARVTGGAFVTETVASSPLSFTLLAPQIVVDAGGNREIVYSSTPDPQPPFTTSFEIRQRSFGAPDWSCIDTGCALPTGPLAGRQVNGEHAYAQGALVLPGAPGSARILRREGPAWVSYPLSVYASASGISRDRLGNLYTVAIDQSSHDDLYMVRVGGPWESRGRIPFDTAVSLSNPLDVASDAAGHPIVYARRSAGAPDPRGALWLIGTGNDFVAHPLPGVFTAEDASIAVASDGVIHVAIRDSDQTNLIHAEFTPAGAGGTWMLETVDLLGDTGDTPTMLIGADGTPMIVYRRRPGTLLLAARGTDGIWIARTLANGALEASKPVAVAHSEADLVHVSWFDETAGVLRISTLSGNPLTSPRVLTDTVPNTPNRVHGDVHDIVPLGDGGLAVAYNEVIPGSMQLVHRARDGNSVWSSSTAPEPFGPGAITRISLEAVSPAPGLARVAWIAGGRLKYGEKHLAIDPWDSEDLGIIPSNAPMQLGTAGPLRITYNEGGGLFVLQRLESLGSNSSLEEILFRVQGGGAYSFCICLAYASICEDGAASEKSAGGNAQAAGKQFLRGGNPPLAPDVLADMRELFSTTPAGRYYLQLFAEHAAEIVRLTLSNPSMLLQRTSTLSDLIPGFAALIESPAAGAQYRFKPELIANARQVVQQWRDFGSPALRRAVDNEFARTQSFNQFQGMTFTEWFNAISVGNATENLFADDFE